MDFAASCLRPLDGYDAATEVGQPDRAYRQAMNAGEVAVLERLTTDDFLFIRRTGEIWTRKRSCTMSGAESWMFRRRILRLVSMGILRF